MTTVLAILSCQACFFGSLIILVYPIPTRSVEIGWIRDLIKALTNDSFLLFSVNTIIFNKYLTGVVEKRDKKNTKYEIYRPLPKSKACISDKLFLSIKILKKTILHSNKALKLAQSL